MLQIVKLTSGVEIVGDVTLVHADGDITVDDPLQISYRTNSNGVNGVALQRYSHFSTQRSFIFKNIHIEAMCKPVEGMDHYYQSALKMIREEIDPALVEDLKVLQQQITNPPTQESYIAMLEQYMSKKPLN